VCARVPFVYKPVCECEPQTTCFNHQSSILFPSAGHLLAARVEGWAHPVRCRLPPPVPSPCDYAPQSDIYQASIAYPPFYFCPQVISWRRVLRAGLTVGSAGTAVAGFILTALGFMLHVDGVVRISLCKMLLHFKALLWESIILLWLSPHCKAYPSLP